jgi:hypothetical protein
VGPLPIVPNSAKKRDPVSVPAFISVDSAACKASVRIDTATHDELKRLASDLGTTVGHTVSLAVRSLRQDQM